MAKRTLHLVSHTHWDREWYLTFQQFRLKLVHLIDGLLDILEHDRNYMHFMLDGQTIVLDDYLCMRPEREAEIRKYIRNGRILVGPWFILPDEFLVSPEATIRNLLEGEHSAKKFGPKMMVGYLPDTFGHIGQMPQILRGFGLETACVWRGLSDEPCEFWWQSPDGTRVLTAYLRESYSNAALLPASEAERFTAEVRKLRDSLAPHSASDHLLLMYGTDHMEPPAETSSAIAATRGKLDGDSLVHSTLPEYIKAMRSSMSGEQLPIVQGELRQCKHSHLLPGVLSARMWIKQRNHACETLLEKWAEPFSTFAALTTNNRQQTLLRNPSSILRQAWRLLMENHPHDSICGCSIDQVHEEMRPRFDQVEQIGEEITRQSLEALAGAICTQPAGQQPDKSAILVFNPIAGPRTDLVTARVEFPGEFEIVDEQGNVLPHQVLSGGSQDLVNAVMGKEELRSGLATIHEGRILGRVVQQAVIQRDGTQARIEVILADSGELDLTAWEKGVGEIEALLADPSLTTYHVRAHSMPAAEFIFTAREIPGHGYRAFWIRPVPASPAKPIKVGWFARLLMPLASRMTRLPSMERIHSRPQTARPPYVIENEYFTAKASPVDGTLTVQDKKTGAVFNGLNRFQDGGDCGDEYNYSPPTSDSIITARLKSVQIQSGSVRQTLELALELDTPVGLAPDRKSRSRDLVTIPITTRVTLTAGVPRLDIQTDVDNRARDHRLRVHFPAPFAVTEADYDGHFEIVRRPTRAPAFDNTWIEQPRPEKPQRAFTDISNGNIGLMIANRGLPEVEVLSPLHGKGKHPEETTEIALTLLRGVNWISRDDFAARKGHAGPMTSTPGAQMISKWRFNYAIIPHAGDWRNTFEQAYAFAAPLRARSADLHDGSLPASQSLAAVTPRNFLISAVKEDKFARGWIVRGYNISGESINVTVKPWRPFKRAEQVNLAEEKQATLKPASDGSVTFVARGHEIVTIMFYQST